MLFCSLKDAVYHMDMLLVVIFEDEAIKKKRGVATLKWLEKALFPALRLHHYGFRNDKQTLLALGIC